MVDADGNRGAGLCGGDHAGGKLEAKKMHGRGLLGVLAFEVFVGDGEHRVEAIDAHPDAVLDALELRQHGLALFLVGVLDLHGDLEVAAVGHQRRIGFQLMPDAVFLEDLFDAQHFLDLIADQQIVLEDQQDVPAQLDAAQLLLRHDLLAHGTARPGIGFESQQ